MIFLLGLLLSAAIGLSLGLLGGGGSILTVPVLVYVLHVEAHQAIGVSLAVVGIASLVGAIRNYQRAQVDLPTVLLFAPSGIAGTFLGSQLTYLLSPSMLMVVFATIMIIVAVMMISKKDWQLTRANQQIVGKAILAGFMIGILTGFLGVGGGFLIVPALLFFGGLDIKKAIGTSLLIIFINCVTGLFSHLSHSSFDIPLTLTVTILAVTGTLIGTAISQRVAAANLNRWFAIFIFLVAIFLLVRNYAAVI